jgi:hypothetical protein
VICKTTKTDPSYLAHLPRLQASPLSLERGNGGNEPPSRESTDFCSSSFLGRILEVLVIVILAPTHLPPAYMFDG